VNAAQATPTVFVVDDDRTFLGALLLALESADLAVETFVSARAFCMPIARSARVAWCWTCACRR